MNLKQKIYEEYFYTFILLYFYIYIQFNCKQLNIIKKVFIISTIRIDKEHAKLLDELISHLILRGKKMNKKELIGKLIEDALITEGLKNSNDLKSIENDPAWKGLKDVFKLGISDLSEKVDDILYKLNGE